MSAYAEFWAAVEDSGPRVTLGLPGGGSHTIFSDDADFIASNHAEVCALIERGMCVYCEREPQEAGGAFSHACGSCAVSLSEAFEDWGSTMIAHGGGVVSGISNVKQGDYTIQDFEMQCSHGRTIFEPCAGCEADGPVDYARDAFVSPNGEMTDRWLHAVREAESEVTR